jgi:hypothetical protein
MCHVAIVLMCWVVVQIYHLLELGFVSSQDVKSGVGQDDDGDEWQHDELDCEQPSKQGLLLRRIVLYMRIA